MNHNKKHKWWHEGIGVGLIMFVIMGIIYPLIDGQKTTIQSFFIQFVVWLAGGLLYGFIFGLITKRIVWKKKMDSPME